MSIEKSINDKREYEYLKLPNNLQCVIIKDSKESICGACLNVHIGSVNEKVDGLAHFLEHMVFMGSKKYPDSNDFMSNINKNGGKTNAYTSDSDTNYHFTIDSKSFPLALDKFAQFFTAPLLKHEFIDKEINAVDSESKKNMLDDAWIQLELYKTLINKEHPINHYTCGDLESLKIANIYNDLKSFHETNYDAKYMTLAIFVNDEIDYEQIKNIILNNFGVIKTNDLLHIKRDYGKILRDKHIVYYVPQRDEHFLTILIEVPTISKMLESPYQFISYIMGSEVDSSLYSYLLNKGYVTKCAVSEMISFEDNTVITMEYILTDEGIQETNIVYSIIISYYEYILNKLRNKDEDLKNLYLEQIQTNKSNFIFWEKGDVDDTIIQMSNIMKEHIPVQYLLSYDTHLADYEVICNNVIKYLTNYSFCISVGSKKNKNICKDIFPRYNVCYKVEKFKLAENIESDIKSFTLPILNDYICYNLLLNETIETMKEPIQIKNSPYNSFYYGDKSYNVPMVDIRATIKIPNIINNVKSYVATILYLNAAYGDINELKELAKTAGYTIYLKIDYDLLYILISGYTENIEMILDIIKRIFYDDFRERSYKTAHYEFLKSLKNTDSLNPLMQMGLLFENEVYKTFFTPEEQYEAVKNIDINKCREIFKKCYNNCRVNILTVGNITKDVCNSLNDKLYTNLNIKSNLELNLDDILKRIDKPVIKHIKSPNKQEENSVAAIIYDLDRFRKHYTKGWKSQVLFYRIYNTLVVNKFFYELRTKRQMGYIARVKTILLDSNSYTNTFIQFLVQSPKYSTSKILEEIQNFIKNEHKYILSEMKESEYEEIRSAEKTKLKHDFISLSDLGSYFMNAVIDESFKFDFKYALLDKIETYDFEKFKKYLNKFMLHNNSIYIISIERNIK